MKVPIKPFKESGLVGESGLRTQRNRRFPRHEKSVIFGILPKGGTDENFFESSNFRNS